MDAKNAVAFVPGGAKPFVPNSAPKVEEVKK